MHIYYYIIYRVKPLTGCSRAARPKERCRARCGCYSLRLIDVAPAADRAAAG